MRISLNFYSGLAGIIFVLAYAEKIFKNPEYGRLARLGTKFLRKHIYQIPEDDLAIGAFSGSSGFAYLFIHLYHLWKKPYLLNDAIYLLQASQKTISTDKNLDIIGGVAGHLAVLVNLKDQIPEEIFSTQAQACVERILDYYPNPAAFPLDGSAIPAKKPLTGAAHGVAGIVWTLAKYNHIFNNDKVTTWIKQGLDYENKSFSIKEKNWLDFRNVTLNPEKSIKHECGLAWCHGAPGIGITRLDMQSLGWHDANIENDINKALTMTRKKGLHGPFNICHGQLGNLEFLLNAEKAGLLAEKDFLAKKQEAADNIMSSKSFITDHVGSVFIPGLMTGVAGAAYQLMRLCYPSKVPSLLLLEAPIKSL